MAKRAGKKPEPQTDQAFPVAPKYPKKSRGRPRLDEADRTLPPFGVRLTPKDREILDQAQAATGRTIGDMLREGGIALAKRLLRKANDRGGKPLGTAVKKSRSDG